MYNILLLGNCLFKVSFKQILLCISIISLAYQLSVEVADSQMLRVKCSVREGFSTLICCSVGFFDFLTF